MDKGCSQQFQKRAENYEKTRDLPRNLENIKQNLNEIAFHIPSGWGNERSHNIGIGENTGN